MRLDEDLECENLISVGASGSGKSYFIKQQVILAQPKRFIIFDVMIEWGKVLKNTVKITGIKALYNFLINPKNELARIQYIPEFSKNEYTIFCKLVKAWASADSGKIWCIIEEAASLANGTGKAQKGELEAITQGRKYAIKFIYIAQSMSEGNKTILKNCTQIRLGRMDLLDIKYFQDRYGKELGDLLRKLKGKEAYLYDVENMCIKLFLPDTSKKDKDN